MTERTYDEIATAATVVLEFTADWCAPCRVFAPVFTLIAEDNPDVVFATVDVDAEPELSRRFAVQSVPTIVALREGVVVFRRPGSLSPDVLQSLVDRLRDIVPEQTERGSR